MDDGGIDGFVPGDCAGALLAGTIVYLAVQYTPDTPPLSAILFALPASVVTMWMGGRYGPPPQQEILETITRLHA